MTIQTPEVLRADTCPHCRDWPLQDETTESGEVQRACDSCGCRFDPDTMELIEAGENCPESQTEANERS